MAPGVLKTFKKEFRQTIYDILEYTDYDKFIAINGIEREIEKLNTIDFNIEKQEGILENLKNQKGVLLHKMFI